MINEPIVFGTPIVMNPLLVIPFYLAPILNVIMTYVAMNTGLVAKPAGIAIPWTTPPIIGGYLATGGHISEAAMQLEGGVQTTSLEEKNAEKKADKKAV
jgi:cellobiose PTS system EIIC component